MRILVSLLTLAVMLIAPATATATPADYGSTARCSYEITATGPYGWTEADLRRIRLTPPQMYAQSGLPTQEVGWGFIVRRSMHRWSGPWQVVRRTRIQMGTATTESAAVFSPMRTGVTVPAVDEPDFIHYRVELKLFWFGADGSVAGKVSHPMPVTIRVNGIDSEGGAGDHCPGRVLQSV